MKILADGSIPFVRSFFGRLGGLTLVDGGKITPGNLGDAELLVVRTVTRVDGELLRGSRVRFVATAASGCDHVDRKYLEDNGIGFAHAPGCNARSVAEYVISSLFVLAEKGGFELGGKSIAIVGCGYVGSCLHTLAGVLGMESILYDPPRRDNEGPPGFSTLEAVQEADIISFHVPLTDTGPYPTAGFVNGDFLAGLKPDVMLINAARGGIVDEAELGRFAEMNPACAVVLDVWRNEPAINADLLQKTDLSTPHIAGYSLDARYNGTRNIFMRVCEAHGTGHNGPAVTVLPEVGVNHIRINEYDSELEAIQMAVLASYDVRTDSACLRQILEMDEGRRAEFFSKLRNDYPARREFTSMRVSLPEGHGSLQRKLEKLGFRVNDR